ncbi:MAG: cyclic pyranopterin monophosphate synthase MoaC [bacterium]
MNSPELTHFDEHGQARMVDVSSKEATVREASARGTVFMQPQTLNAIMQNEIKKGNALEVAKIAGIMAAKRTSSLIPLCHQIPLTAIDLDFAIDQTQSSIIIESRVRTIGQTGVEMEALVAVSVAALTIYDMCKAIDRAMSISNIVLMKKSGGRSGTFIREGSEAAVTGKEGAEKNP